MTELTWENLRVATEPGNHAFSPLEMLGRVNVLLAQDMQGGTSNTAFDNDATLARRALSTVERIWDNRRQRNGGREDEDLVAVVKATEAVLDRAAGLFGRNGCGQPYDVLAECYFHEAGKVVCNDNGVSRPGDTFSRYSDQTMDAEKARRVIQSDRARRADFERKSNADWLRESAHTQPHRVAWKPAAEMWARLARRLDEELPSDPPRLPHSPESPGLVSG